MVEALESKCIDEVLRVENNSGEVESYGFGLGLFIDGCRMANRSILTLVD